jgi:hypothetical protein
LLLFSKRSAFLPLCARKRFFFEKKNQKTFINDHGIMIGAGRWPLFQQAILSPG